MGAARLSRGQTHETLSIPVEDSGTLGLTLAEVYDAYMSDPTRDWSPRTRLAYQTTRTLALAVFGAKTPIRAITRAHCRDFIQVLRWLPRNSSKLYPKLPPREVAARAEAEERSDLISPANLNAYLNKLSGVFAWAMKEQMIDRNPAVGLKVPDPTLRREKRLPFSDAQLRAIFSAPSMLDARMTGMDTQSPAPTDHETLGSGFRSMRVL